MKPDATDAFDRDISTAAEFESALESLLLAVLDNGLDPRGSWEYRNGRAWPDIEVLIWELG